MTRICVLSHSFQHSAQIRASISAPSEPGSPTFPAPTLQSPAQSAGSMLRPVTATRRGTELGSRGDPVLDPCRLRAARLRPDLGDLVDHLQEGLGVAELERALDLGALLRRLPAELGDVGVLLDVLGLEAVAPQY